jgi:hypothetical protein
MAAPAPDGPPNYAWKCELCNSACAAGETHECNIVGSSRDWIVMRRTVRDEGDHWKVIGHAQARSANQAIEMRVPYGPERDNCVAHCAADMKR